MAPYSSPRNLFVDMRYIDTHVTSQPGGSKAKQTRSGYVFLRRSDTRAAVPAPRLWPQITSW